MYVIVEGEPKVFVQGVGLVAQLAPGKYFGELAIVDAPASYRSATVMSVGPTKCLRLSQHDVHRLLSSAKCAEVRSPATLCSHSVSLVSECQM